MTELSEALLDIADSNEPIILLAGVVGINPLKVLIAGALGVNDPVAVPRLSTYEPVVGQICALLGPQRIAIGAVVAADATDATTVATRSY